MQIILIRKNTTIDISNYITNATLFGEYRSCCRTLDFGIINNPNLLQVAIELGDNIKLVENNKTLFYGIVWEKSKGTDTNEISIHAKDYGIYLNKNKGSFKFKQISPESITRHICSKFGIKIGTLARGGKAITRNYLGVSLYDIIITSYSIASEISKKKYMIMFNLNELNVIEKGSIFANPISVNVNLLSSSVSESLNNMVNRVNIYNDKDQLIKTVENSNDIKLYGLMAEYMKVSDNTKEDYMKKANETLESVDRKITVTNFGDVDYITGKAVIVTEPYTNLRGKFYIDSDEHNWKNGIYTNKLVLNFQNLMDDKESGSNE